MSEKGDQIAIGIDLGTTYSCVAYVNEKKETEIIENKSTGTRITPSICVFNNSNLRVGKTGVSSEREVYQVKRLIGTKFNDPQVQKDIRNLTFKITEREQKPQIHIDYKDKEHTFFPEQISAFILRELKKTAEIHFGKSVKAVITVPAYFNDQQRQATLDAAKIAGLEVLRIIPEPTAAAIAYGFQRRLNEKCTVLIFDLGGGTFDVSIIQVDNGDFKVLAIDGDSHLGGTDFDNRMVDHFKKVLKDEYKIDIEGNKKAILKLKKKCEEAKRDLTQVYETTIEIESLIGDFNFDYQISRAIFNDLNRDLFARTIEKVKATMEKAGLEKKDIDDVVLVGGSSRIPEIKSMLQEFFVGKGLKQNINPDEVVAYGAAIQAAFLTGSLDGRIKNITDAIPNSLGIELYDKTMSIFFKKNTSIPKEFTKDFTNPEDDIKQVEIRIYEGEDKIAKNNNLLGKFLLNGIQIGPKDTAKIRVTFKIDENGILNVTAVDLDTKMKNEILIDKGGLSNIQIKQMTNELNDIFNL